MFAEAELIAKVREEKLLREKSESVLGQVSWDRPRRREGEVITVTVVLNENDSLTHRVEKTSLAFLCRPLNIDLQ